MKHVLCVLITTLNLFSTIDKNSFFFLFTFFIQLLLKDAISRIGKLLLAFQKLKKLENTHSSSKTMYKYFAQIAVPNKLDSSVI